DQDALVAIDDHAAGGRDGDRADLVGGDGRGGALGLDHLEAPEAQDHDTEQHQEEQPDDDQAHVGTGRLLLGRGHEGRDVQVAPGPHPRPAGAGGRLAGRMARAQVAVVAPDRVAEAAPAHRRSPLTSSDCQGEDRRSDVQLSSPRSGSETAAFHSATTATITPRLTFRICGWPRIAPSTAYSMVAAADQTNATTGVTIQVPCSDS